MKKLKYLLSVLTILCLTLFTNVFAVDITYVGKYIDITNNNTVGADKIYFYFCVRNHLANGPTNRWVETYSYLDYNAKKVPSYTGLESEHLDGSLASYNTDTVTFTGLVSKGNDKTTVYSYKLNGKETQDTRHSNKDSGNMKVAYDILSGEGKDILVEIADEKRAISTEKVHVATDAVTVSSSENINQLLNKFTPRIAYINTSNYEDNNYHNMNQEQIISWDLKINRTIRQNISNISKHKDYYLLYTRISTDYHENIEVLTKEGLQKIAAQYASYYGMSLNDVYKSIKDSGIRFSRTIATEAAGNATWEGGCYVDEELSGTIKTGGAAIYALQFGTGFTSYNTGFKYGSLGWGYGTENEYMVKDNSKTVTGQSVLNNYDNILRVPIKRGDIKVYVQFNRKTNAESDAKKYKIVRMPEWAGNIIPEKYQDEQALVKITNPAGEVIIKPQASDDPFYTAQGFDDMFVLSQELIEQIKTISTNSDDYYVNIELKQDVPLTIEINENQETINHKLILEQCKYFICSSITEAAYNLNYSNQKLTLDSETAKKITADVFKEPVIIAVKLVYEPVPSDNKVYVQYKTQDYKNLTTKEYADPKIREDFANQGYTTVYDKTNKQNILIDKDSEKLQDIQDIFKISMSNFSISFKERIEVGEKIYQLVEDNSYYILDESEEVIASSISSLTQKIPDNPIDQLFRKDQKMGITLLYKEVTEPELEEDVRYITLGGFEQKGTLQFINVAETNEHDFYIKKDEYGNPITYASDIIYDAGVIKGTKNDSIINATNLENDLRSKFSFIDSTYTEGKTTYSGSSIYDFIPTGEYISPYVTDAYSYVIRGMTWKVNENMYDIVRHTTTIKRSYFYIMRWAKVGLEPPGFAEHVGEEWFTFVYTETPVDTSTEEKKEKYRRYFYNDPDPNPTLTSSDTFIPRNTFYKYWETTDLCPYATGLHSGESDHYHSSDCCPGMDLDDFRKDKTGQYALNFNITVQDDGICGYERNIFVTKHTYVVNKDIDPDTEEEYVVSEYWEHSGPSLYEHQTKYNSDTTWPTQPSDEPMPAADEGASYNTYGASSWVEIPCPGSVTYSRLSNECEVSSINTVYHTTEQVRAGLCNDDPQDGKDNYRNFSINGTGYITVQVKQCSNYSQCEHKLSGTEGSGSGYAKHDGGVECAWKDYYNSSYAIDALPDGSKVKDPAQTQLYTGHYHTLLCFKHYYDNEEQKLETTKEWRQQYLDRVAPDEHGHLPTQKQSGIADIDVYMAGMDRETWDILSENNILPENNKYRLENPMQNRTYGGTYTLKYYTIENFKLYKISKLLIYHKEDNLGETILGSNDVSVEVDTSLSYDKLFEDEKLDNGVVTANNNASKFKVTWAYNYKRDIDDKDFMETENRMIQDASNTKSIFNMDLPIHNDKTFISKVNYGEREYTMGQIRVRENTYVDNGEDIIYPYVGAVPDPLDPLYGGKLYGDTITGYKNWEDSYVFLADEVGYQTGRRFEIKAKSSIDAITDTEVALRLGVTYEIAEFYNDYFRFAKDYSTEIKDLEHHVEYDYDAHDKGYNSSGDLLNINENWIEKVEYKYTWQKGMEVNEEAVENKDKDTLFKEKSFLSLGAEQSEIDESKKYENELQKFFDATNFNTENGNKPLLYANDNEGGKYKTSSDGLEVRGITGTYVSGENVNDENNSSYKYVKNYKKFTDNSSNDKLTDICDWSLINVPVNALFGTGEDKDGDGVLDADGIGNGKREFYYDIVYELVNQEKDQDSGGGSLYIDAYQDNYTNYTEKGVATHSQPDISVYEYIKNDRNIWRWNDNTEFISDVYKKQEQKYTNLHIDIEEATKLKNIENTWSEPNFYKKHKQETGVHIKDVNFTGEGDYERQIKLGETDFQDVYLNVLTPVSISDFKLTSFDMIEHVEVTSENSISNVLGKNTEFQLTWNADYNNAGVNYGIAENKDYHKGVHTEKYTKEYWIQCDFEVYCKTCREHPSGGGYHPAYDLIRVKYTGSNIFNGRTTGTYADPAVGTGENFIKIFAVAQNTPSNLEDYVITNDIENGQYMYEDENKNTFENRQTGVMNQIDALGNELYKLTMDDAFHIAYQEFDSDSIFRIFGFEITDFKDIAYKEVFKNGIEPTENYYAGRKEWIYEIYLSDTGSLIDGATSNTMYDRWNGSPINKNLTLPIGPYSNTNTGYIYAPKLGYTFSFNLKTTGYLRNSNLDNTRFIKIIPSYYYISKDGSEYISNVDLYYKDSNGIYSKFVNSGYQLGFKPNDGYRTLRFVDIEGYSPNLLSSEIEYLDISSSEGFELDNKFMTTSYTNFIQTWYGEFKLPNSVIAVDPKDNESTVNNPLKDGYIGVKFQIYAEDEAEEQRAYYYENEKDTKDWGAYGNYGEDNKVLTTENTSQWDYEGNFGFDYSGRNNYDSFEYKLEKGTWSIKDSVWQEIKSTVVLYDTDLRAEDDFQ